MHLTEESRIDDMHLTEESSLSSEPQGNKLPDPFYPTLVERVLEYLKPYFPNASGRVDSAPPDFTRPDFKLPCGHTYKEHAEMREKGIRHP